MKNFEIKNFSRNADGVWQKYLKLSDTEIVSVEFEFRPNADHIALAKCCFEQLDDFKASLLASPKRSIKEELRDAFASAKKSVSKENIKFWSLAIEPEGEDFSAEIYASITDQKIDPRKGHSNCPLLLIGTRGKAPDKVMKIVAVERLVDYED